MEHLALIPELHHRLRGSLRRMLALSMECGLVHAFLLLTSLAGLPAGVRLPIWLWIIVGVQLAGVLGVSCRAVRMRLPLMRRVDEEIVLAELLVAAGLMVREGWLWSEVRGTLTQYLPVRSRVGQTLDRVLGSCLTSTLSSSGLGLRIILLGFAFAALAEQRMRRIAMVAAPLLVAGATVAVMGWIVHFVIPFLMVLR